MFPTDAEKDRARQSELNYALFRGKFRSVLRYFRTTDDAKNQLEVIQNLPGAMTRVFADLMFLQEPEYEVASMQDDIDDFVHRNAFNDTLYESALTQSYDGRAAFELILRDGLAYVEELNPSTVFPQWNHVSIKQAPDKVIIAWEFERTSEHGTVYKYRFIKTHTIGSIDYKVVKLDNDGKELGAAPLALFDASLPEHEDTELDFIPVYFVDNHKTSRDMRGISDYDDILTMLTELTRVQSQIATQLKKHANAKMAVPPGVLDEKGKVINEDLEMIEVSNDETGGMIVPQYIVNSNPLVDLAFKEQENLIQGIMRVCEVSSLLLDMDTRGGVERVGALKIRLMRTLAKKERKLRPYRRVIRKMFVDAMKLEGKELDHKDINIYFSDGLPVDELERAQIQATRIGSGTQTVKDAVADMDGMKGEALETKIEDIKKEAEARREFVGAGVPQIQF